jgi:hypothetical protein
MALQRSAGNAAVTSLIRPNRPRSGAPTAPRPAAPDPLADEATDEAAASGDVMGELVDQAGAGPAGATGATGAVAEPPPPTRQTEVREVEPEQRELSDEDIEAKVAEGETGSEVNEPVPDEGGAAPVATSGGFEDAGRRTKVPFHDSMLEHFQSGRDREPRAFTSGGRSGTKAWAGGGGAGPKGNQKSGSITTQVEPVYESEMGGITENANAWVQEGTGVANVTRSFVSSDAGDQGNGWYITAAAASALTAHEQKHLNSSREMHDSYLTPATDRVAKSHDLGRGKTYWQSDARALLKRQIDWSSSMKKFTEGDETYNAPGGNVDTEDYGSAAYPRQIGPGKVGGKDFTNRLVMSSEPDPA